jgi:hypothetical protein
MVADDRIVQRPVQDLGVAGSIRNAFEVTRALTATRPTDTSPARSRWAELAIVAAIAGANTTGAVVGTLSGHGRAGEHYE